MADLLVVQLVLFAAATFAAAFVAGIAGFAFGVVAAAVWLHFLPPAQCAALIVAFGLIVQGWAVWKLRKAVNITRLLPFVIGGAVGVPLGTEILHWSSSATLRFGIGAILIAFSVYSLLRPKLPSAARVGWFADGSIGVVNGALSGVTGFAGIVTTIWCTVRGWSPPEQRAVFQPAAVSVFLMTALWLGGTGFIGKETTGMFLVGLPPLLLGHYAGLKAFDRLKETGFRRVVMSLLLLSGLSLVVLGR